MLPLNDTSPNRYSPFPFMTISLISLNLLILIYAEHLGANNIWYLRELYYLYGSVPRLILAGEGGGALTAITATFLHAGLLHLASNMLALWVFGRRVEDACGSWAFLILYLLCGITGDIASTAVHASSGGPSVGASGAVFGIMGAYLLLFPGGRIRVLLPIFFVPLFPKIRAFWIVLYFLLAQIPAAYAVLVSGAEYGIGYWAHLGGFFGGFLVFLLLRPEAMHRYRLGLPV